MHAIKLLYVESRSGSGRSAARRLKARGFDVHASSFSSFSSEVRSKAPDLVICELDGASGAKTLRAVKSVAPDLPVLGVGAKGAASSFREAGELGLVGFLTKPLRIADLELAVQRALEQPGRRDLERLAFANRQLAALNHVSNRFSRIRDQGELLEAVPRLLTESLEFDRGILLLHDGRSLSVRSVCFPKDPPEFEEIFHARIQSGALPLPPPIAECFERNEPAFIADPNADPRWPRAPGEVIRTRSIVIAPIRSQNQPIGVMVGNMQHQRREIDARDVARFEMFANMVGLALDNLRAYQRLELTVAERTESLRKANEELQAILDSSLAAIVMVDPEGRILARNRRVEEFFGAGAESFAGIEELHQRLRAKASDPALLDRVVRGQMEGSGADEEPIAHYENAVRLLGPSPRHVTVLSSPVMGGRVWVYTDVTERYQARQKLKLYRQIFDRSYDGIVVLDANGAFVERNPIHRLLSGFSDEDLIGRSAAEFFGEGMVQSVLKAVRDSGSFRGELLAPKVDGSRTPIEISVFSILNDAGEIINYVAIGRDIAERKEAEQALQRAHHELEERVKARTAELARLNQTLLNEVAERKQADEALRRSHELLSKQNAVLAEFSKRLSPERGNLESLVGELTRAGSSTLDVARVSVWMYREDDAVIECLDLYDAGSDRHEGGQRLAKLDFPSYFRALGEQRAIAAHDAHRDPRTREFSQSYLAPLGITSMLDAPIWLEGKVVGVVCHEHVGPPRTWTPEEVRFAASVADFASLTLEAHQRFRAEQNLRKAHDELETRVEQRTAQLARMNVAYRDEIHERRLAQEALAVRLRYEEGLAACSKTLLTESDFGSALPQALRHLLAASEASGVYLFENFEDPIEGLSMRPSYEIAAEGVERASPPARPAAVSYRRLERWRAEFSAGNAIGGVVASLPEDERLLLSSFQVSSLLALPLFVDGAWQGFLGFLDLEREREWSKEDTRSLETAAEMVGVYLGRKRAAEALRVSEERFRSLVENANDVIFSMKIDGRLTYLSPKFTEATGYAVEEVLGKTLFPMMHPDDQGRARRWLDHGLETGERFSGFEYRFRHKDGAWRWWVATASVLRDDDGRPREIIGVAHDFTQTKEMLEDLARANRDLRATQSQLVQSEKMASLGSLVAGIAHEINTPVGAISSMHDTLVRALRKLEGTLNEEHPGIVDSSPSLQTALKLVQEANRVIESGTQRVTEIVRRLRSFARLDQAELKKADIHEGLEDTLALIHHELKHSIVVKREYGEIPPISCYPGRLNQVFLNLLNNARQAIRGKGEIGIRTFIRDHRVHIAVSDTGLGISPDHLRKIFDPGFTTKGVGVGTGLGLSICYQIVQDHRGEILVESEPGRGATFTVVLPMNLDQSAPLVPTSLTNEAR